jgi:hypothetical protein
MRALQGTRVYRSLIIDRPRVNEKFSRFEMSVRFVSIPGDPSRESSSFSSVLGLRYAKTQPGCLSAMRRIFCRN